jgi:Dna[CI] antecedent, DciA
VPRAWREPELIGGAVRRQLGRFGDPGRLGEVVAAWPQAVGEQVAANAWPARIGRDGTLVVHARDAIWAFELGQRATEILAALALGLAGIRFVPGPVPDPGTGDAEREIQRVQVTDEQLRFGREVAAGIADEELRERVSRAVAASLARAAGGRSVW